MHYFLIFAKNYSAQLFLELSGSYLKMCPVESNSLDWDESDCHTDKGINGLFVWLFLLVFFIGSVDNNNEALERGLNLMS